MKLDPSMYQDEFDVYFARAALERKLEETAAADRRGSLPTTTLIVEPAASPMCRRTASCKFPSKRRGNRSPRDGSRSPRRPSSQLEVSNNNMLKAPSPLIGDSDFKCHSAPHSRSSSWKKMKRPRSTRDVRDSDEQKRRESIPLEDAVSAKLEQLRLLQAEDACVVRNFATSSKGLIMNRGDSFKRKSSISMLSDAGSASSGIDIQLGGDRSRAQSVHSQASTAPSSGSEPMISKVMVIGRHGVGRTALLQQFMTSEYMGAVETNFDDDCEKTVSVLLDGEETMIDFVDVPYDQDHRQYGEADGYIIVYAINDRDSYHFVISMLQEIRRHDGKHSAIIVVANKSDLVRTRQITEQEAKDVCTNYDSKYIEVSAALNHKVDDLLVGIVQQIRLNPQRRERRMRKPDLEVKESCVKSAKGLLQKLFKKQSFVSRSCDNLLVL